MIQNVKDIGSIWKNNEKDVQGVAEHFKELHDMFPQEFVQKLRHACKEHDKRGKKKDAFVFAALSTVFQMVKWQLNDQEILTKKVAVIQGTVLMLIEGNKIVSKLLENLVKQLPEEADKIEKVREELTHYRPILEAVYKEIDAEKEKMMTNTERLHKLGDVYH